MEFIWGGNFFKNVLINLCKATVIFGGREYFFEKSIAPRANWCVPVLNRVIKLDYNIQE